jgi:hypothetical protein
MNRVQLMNDAESAHRYAQDELQSRLWTAFPGIVQEVNFATMTCKVQPAIQGVVTNYSGLDSYVNLPILLDCPIVFPSAGGFSLTFPMAIGDEVLMVIASRCIDSWWQNGGIQPPIELRMHDLSDGFAIPGPKSQPRVLSGISSTNAQLRNDEGTVYLEITPSGGMNLVAPSGVGITGNLNVTGTITATVDVIGGPDSISLSTHEHSGVTPGGGVTGPPVP